MGRAIRDCLRAASPFLGSTASSFPALEAIGGRVLPSWSRQHFSTDSAPRHPHVPEGDSPSDDVHATSFGYRRVNEDEKQSMVDQVFTSVASKYDVMNDVMSGGLHRIWKDHLVERLRPFPGMQHVDVAGGTGDVAFRVLRAIRAAESSPYRQPFSARASDAESARVLVCDINPEMLEEGKKKAKALGIAGDPALEWAQGNAEDLTPVIPNTASLDSYTIAFGLRNVTHIESALAEAYRVLREGGHFLCLEFSHVQDPALKQLYDAYSFAVIPTLGKVIAGDSESYQYLVESIRKFPRQELLSELMREAGFQKVTYENLTGGIVALHSGYKL